MSQGFLAGLLGFGVLALLAGCGAEEVATPSGGSGGTLGSDGGSRGSAASGDGGGSSSAASGDGGGSSSAPTEERCPDDVDEMVVELANAICDKRVDCCESDEAQCLADVLEALVIFSNLGAAERAGTAFLSCGALGTCVGAIEAAGCEDWPYQSGGDDSLGGIPVDEQACRELITPMVSDGGRCTHNYECDNGLCLFPEAVDGEPEPEAGECVQFEGLNADCGEGRLCDPETMFCNAGGKCQPLLGNGARCTSNGECDSRLCDVGESEECIAPGPAQCEYVPNGFAEHCSLVGASAQRRGPLGLPLLLSVVGLAALAMRRRRRRHAASP